ncbi:unnamed protein product, partial [Callosobruchus maculatus]
NILFYFQKCFVQSSKSYGETNVDNCCIIPGENKKDQTISSLIGYFCPKSQEKKEQRPFPLLVTHGLKPQLHRRCVIKSQLHQKTDN